MEGGREDKRCMGEVWLHVFLSTSRVRGGVFIHPTTRGKTNMQYPELCRDLIYNCNEKRRDSTQKQNGKQGFKKSHRWGEILTDLDEWKNLKTSEKAKNIQQKPGHGFKTWSWFQKPSIWISESFFCFDLIWKFSNLKLKTEGIHPNQQNISVMMSNHQIFRKSDHRQVWTQTMEPFKIDAERLLRRLERNVPHKPVTELSRGGGVLLTVYSTSRSIWRP